MEVCDGILCRLWNESFFQGMSVNSSSDQCQRYSKSYLEVWKGNATYQSTVLQNDDQNTENWQTRTSSIGEETDYLWESTTDVLITANNDVTGTTSGISTTTTLQDATNSMISTSMTLLESTTSSTSTSTTLSEKTNSDTSSSTTPSDITSNGTPTSTTLSDTTSSGTPTSTTISDITASGTSTSTTISDTTSSGTSTSTKPSDITSSGTSTSRTLSDTTASVASTSTTQSDTTSSGSSTSTTLSDTTTSGTSTSTTLGERTSCGPSTSTTLSDATTRVTSTSTTLIDTITSSTSSSTMLLDSAISSATTSSTTNGFSATTALLGSKTSGVSISTTITESPIEACVMQYQFQDGKIVDIPCLNDTYHWIVIQRRIDGSVDFYRNWTEYENGFGSVNSEIWLGNQYINELTSSGYTILRLDMMDQDSVWRHVEYNFTIEDRANKYRLHIVCRESCDIDSMWTGLFSTYDEDNDNWKQKDCALDYSGGWWYSGDAYCTEGNLNGMYSITGQHNEKRGIYFFHWHGYEPLKYVRMMIRQP
ncbi:serine-rich adhesin for platelets-like [Saccostrea echinata]|uniref:serine-rich adhesin for platelets-like n=1 Tax=Saccostrea echinata TaxID=191078 RepID=UPI002A7F2805|nr:serine-rich adhesin for platelets-like [Saccostrea echinata]